MVFLFTSLTTMNSVKEHKEMLCTVFIVWGFPISCEISLNIFFGFYLRALLTLSFQSTFEVTNLKVIVLGDTEKVCRCITAGLFPNAAYLHYSGVYRTVRGDQELYIHPTSVLYTLEQPKWYVMVLEVFHL